MLLARKQPRKRSSSRANRGPRHAKGPRRWGGGAEGPCGCFWRCSHCRLSSWLRIHPFARRPASVSRCNLTRETLRFFRLQWSHRVLSLFPLDSRRPQLQRFTPSAKSSAPAAAFLVLLCFAASSAAQTQVRLLPAPREAHFGADNGSAGEDCSSPSPATTRKTSLPRAIWKTRSSVMAPDPRSIAHRRRAAAVSRHASPHWLRGRRKPYWRAPASPSIRPWNRKAMFSSSSRTRPRSSPQPAPASFTACRPSSSCFRCPARRACCPPARCATGRPCDIAASTTISPAARFPRSNSRSTRFASSPPSRSTSTRPTSSTRCFIPISRWPRRRAAR